MTGITTREGGLRAEMTAALGPVAGSLLRSARSDAARIRAEADDAADEARARARAQATRILADARAAGRSEATASAGPGLARARRRARSIVLAARREAYEELRRRTGAALAALCEDPATAERLRRLARDRAGPRARITTAPGGGVIADAGGRRVDCSASSLADRAVDLLGGEVARLWES